MKENTFGDKTDNNDKHAFLIMAHNRPDVLKELLAALDDPRNDIYLHIDKKAGDDMDADNFHIVKSNLFKIPRISVNWGGYSQIKCELNLLEEARKNGAYKYYHLLTGVTYPIVSNDHMHDYFEKNSGYEFIEYSGSDFYDRVCFVWLFNEAGKIKENDIRFILTRRFLNIQAFFHIDRFKRFGLKACKGLAYWSITDECAGYILSQKRLIKKMMKHSTCGDEVFMHTLIYNSPFIEKIYKKDDGNSYCARLSTWGIEEKFNKVREDHNFKTEDFRYIMDSGDIFALKFDGACGPELIKMIKEEKLKEEKQKVSV